VQSYGCPTSTCSGWVPTESMGSSFGNYAALAAGKARLLPGTNVWLDLEGVEDGVSADDVIAYCNASFEEVDELGFASGVYIGALPGPNSRSIVCLFVESSG
jgi:hypothetical protein